MQKTLFLIVFVVIVVVACKHKEKSPCYCDPPAHSGPLRFIIKDKTTGVDLFFAPHPKYAFSDLQVYNTRFGYNGLLVDTIHSPHSFMVDVGLNGLDTLVLKISNTGPDTLRYTAEITTTGCCSIQGKLSNFYFDSQPLYLQPFVANWQLDSTIVTLYK